LFPQAAIDEIGHPKAAPTAQEMEMALFLITAMTGAFEPAKYRDEYEIAIRKVVEAKLAGKELNVPEVPQAEITDLIAALRASIDAARKVKEQPQAAESANN
jgi:DNA end-binding protein Ku